MKKLLIIILLAAGFSVHAQSTNDTIIAKRWRDFAKPTEERGLKGPHPVFRQIPRWTYKADRANDSIRRVYNIIDSAEYNGLKIYIHHRN